MKRKQSLWWAMGMHCEGVHVHCMLSEHAMRCTETVHRSKARDAPLPECAPISTDVATSIPPAYAV